MYVVFLPRFSSAILLTLRSNKWVLNVTTAPLFFLLAQFIIAVILFYLCHALKIITVPMMRVDIPVLKGLASTVIFNVLALRYTSTAISRSLY